MHLAFCMNEYQLIIIILMRQMAHDDDDDDNAAHDGMFVLVHIFLNARNLRQQQHAKQTNCAVSLTM